MRALLNLCRLALSLGRPRHYLALVRALAVFLIGGLLTFTVLVTISAGQIADRQQVVADARTPYEPARIDPQGTALRVGTFVNDWGGKTVTRVAIDTQRGRDAVPPPGIPRIPRPGEAYVSPAVSSALGSSEYLRAALRNFEVIGVIQDEGLLHPSEMRIIEGVSGRASARSVMTSATSFGASGPDLVDFSGALAFLLPLVLLVSLSPVTLALAMMSRLLAPETDQRFAILQAFGTSSGQCRLIAAVEVAPYTLLGATGGWFLFYAGWSRMSHVPATPFNYWPSDAALPWAVQLVVALTIVALCCSFSAVAVTRPRDANIQSYRNLRRPSHWWLLPTMVGSLLLVLSAWSQGDSARAKSLSIWAAIAFLLGIGPALQFLVGLLAEGLARRSPGASGLIAGRWMGRRTAATARVAASLSVGVLVAGITAPFAVSLRGDTTIGEQGLRAANGFNLIVDNTMLTPAQLQRLSGVDSVLSFTDAQDRRGNVVSVLLASCRQLIQIVEVSGCTGRTQWISIFRDRRMSDYPATLRAPITSGRPGLRIESLPDTVAFAPLGGTFADSLRYEPRDSRHLGQAGQSYFVNLASGTALRTFEAELAAVAPTAYLANDYEVLIKQADMYLVQLTLLQVALGIGLLGVFLALVASCLRTVDERRREMSAIVVVGASTPVRVRAHLLSQGLPVFTAVGLAVGLSLLYWKLAAYVDPSAAVEGRWYALSALLPLVLASLVSTATLPAAFSNYEDSTGRRPIWS